MQPCSFNAVENMLQTNRMWISKSRQHWSTSQQPPLATPLSCWKKPIWDHLAIGYSVLSVSQNSTGSLDFFVLVCQTQMQKTYPSVACAVQGVVCDDWLRFKAANLFCKDLEKLLQAFCNCYFTGIFRREDVFCFNNPKN